MTAAAPAQAGEEAKEAAPKEHTRLSSIPKPDGSLLAEAAKEDEAKERHTARLAQIDALLKQRTAARKEGGTNPEQAATKAKLAEVRAVISKRSEERLALREELKAYDEARVKAKEEVASLKSSLKFRSVADIDAEIARLEHDIAHTTMPLNDEKKLLTQIKELNKSKALVDVHAEKAGKLVGGEDVRKSLWDRLKEKETEISALYGERNALRDALTAFRAKEEAKTADVPALQEERAKVWDLLQAARTDARKHRDAHKAAEDAWWAHEKLLRVQLREEKQKKWEEVQAERKARAEARRKFEEENAPVPYEQEVLVCEQLASYLAQWAPDAPDAPSEAPRAPLAPAAAGPRRAPEAPVTSVLVGKKAKDDGCDAKYAVSSKKKTQPPPAAAAAAARPASSQKMVHSVDAISGFSKIGVDAPATVAAVAAAKAEVAAKRARYLELRANKVAKKAEHSAEAAKAVAEGKPAPPPPQDELLVSLRLRVVKQERVAVDLVPL